MIDKKKKLKVVHIISDLPYGGVEKFLLDLLPRFKDIFDTWICCIREKGKLAPEFEKRGIERIRLINLRKRKDLGPQNR